MNATEFCALGPNTIAKLLSGRQKSLRPTSWHGRRNAPRWPFPSTVELWVPNAAGEDQYCLATSINLSLCVVPSQQVIDMRDAQLVQTKLCVKKLQRMTGRQ